MKTIFNKRIIEQNKKLFYYILLVNWDFLGIFKKLFKNTFKFIISISKIKNLM